MRALKHRFINSSAPATNEGQSVAGAPQKPAAAARAFGFCLVQEAASRVQKAIRAEAPSISGNQEL
jgi:hypothetical protein